MLPYQVMALSITHEHSNNFDIAFTNNPLLFKNSVWSLSIDVRIATSMPLVWSSIKILTNTLRST